MCLKEDEQEGGQWSLESISRSISFAAAKQAAHCRNDWYDLTARDRHQIAGLLDELGRHYSQFALHKGVLEYSDTPKMRAVVDANEAIARGDE